MKILIVADEPSRKIWDYFEPHMLDKYDLILSAGDLSPHYLQFLVTMSHAPLYYVHGNHDTRYETDPPDGCICIEDKIVTFRGLRILGLGGSMRYKPGPCMYTEKEMRRRVRRLWFPLLKNHGFDMLLTHAPAEGLNDSEDLPHHGFGIFRELLDKYKPAYFVHGHMHKSYGGPYKKDDMYGETHVINGYVTYELDIPDK